MGKLLSPPTRGEPETPFVDQWAQDWLYGKYDKEKLRQFELLYHIPFVGNYMDYMLDVRADEEYLDRFGMDYSDIHDPRKLHQTHSGASMVSSAYRMISKNIHELYK